MEINYGVQKIQESIEKRKIMKALGPDGVLSWIIRECNHQLADKVHSVILIEFLKDG